MNVNRVYVYFGTPFTIQQVLKSSLVTISAISIYIAKYFHNTFPYLVGEGKSPSCFVKFIIRFGAHIVRAGTRRHIGHIISHR